MHTWNNRHSSSIRNVETVPWNKVDYFFFNRERVLDRTPTFEMETYCDFPLSIFSFPYMLPPFLLS